MALGIVTIAHQFIYISRRNYTKVWTVFTLGRETEKAEAFIFHFVSWIVDMFKPCISVIFFIFWCQWRWDNSALFCFLLFTSLRKGKLVNIIFNIDKILKIWLMTKIYLKSLSRLCGKSLWNPKNRLHQEKEVVKTLYREGSTINREHLSFF